MRHHSQSYERVPRPSFSRTKQILHTNTSLLVCPSPSKPHLKRPPSRLPYRAPVFLSCLTRTASQSAALYRNRITCSSVRAHALLLPLLSYCPTHSLVRISPTIASNNVLVMIHFFVQQVCTPYPIPFFPRSGLSHISLASLPSLSLLLLSAHHITSPSPPTALSYCLSWLDLASSRLVETGTHRRQRRLHITSLPNPAFTSFSLDQLTCP